MTMIPPRSAGFSSLAIIAALVGLVAFGLAGVLFVQGDAATERLGLLFALIGTVTTALVALLRADQAKTQTDGTLTAVTAQAEAFRQRLPAHEQKAALDDVELQKATEAQRQVHP